MTEVTYTERDNRVRITVTGHAQFNPGNDIVCAGISAITFQLLSYVAAMQMEGQIEDAASEVKDGWVIVTFVLLPGSKQAWDTAWKVIKMGYQNISEEYPKHLSIG